MTEKEQIAAEIHHLITGCVANYTPENQHAHKLLQKVLDFIDKMPENCGLERSIQSPAENAKKDEIPVSEELLEALHAAAYLDEMEFYGGLKYKLRELYEHLITQKENE